MGKSSLSDSACSRSLGFHWRRWPKHMKLSRQTRRARRLLIWGITAAAAHRTAADKREVPTRYNHRVLISLSWPSGLSLLENAITPARSADSIVSANEAFASAFPVQSLR